MKKADTVDKYIASAPKNVQIRLHELRNVIRSTAPKASEKISYGMPYYGYKGRLAYFAYFKRHIGFYAMRDVLDDYKDEVKDIRFGRATLRFPLNEKIPTYLIKKIIKKTIKKNES